MPAIPSNANLWALLDPLKQLNPDQELRPPMMFPNVNQLIQDEALQENDIPHIQQPAMIQPKVTSQTVSKTTRPSMEQQYSTELDKSFYDGMNNRKSFVNDLKNQLTDLQSKDTTLADVNLKPLMAWADSIGGTNVSSGYTAPTSLQDRKNQIMKLQDAIARNEGAMSDDELNYLKSKAMESKENRIVSQFNAGQDYKKQRLGYLDDALAMKAGKQIDSDNMIQTITTQNQNLEKAQHTLKGGMITPQLLSEIEMDVAAALSGKGQATDHVRKSVEMGSFDRKMTELKQMLSSSPQGVNMPEYADYLHSVIDRLKEANSININGRVNQLQTGYQNMSSKKVKDVVKDKVESLSSKNQVHATESPEVGTVVDGYRFNGGNPSNPASWEQVK